MEVYLDPLALDAWAGLVFSAHFFCKLREHGWPTAGRQAAETNSRERTGVAMLLRTITTGEHVSFPRGHFRPGDSGWLLRFHNRNVVACHPCLDACKPD